MQGRYFICRGGSLFSGGRGRGGGSVCLLLEGDILAWEGKCCFLEWFLEGAGGSGPPPSFSEFAPTSPPPHQNFRLPPLRRPYSSLFARRMMKNFACGGHYYFIYHFQLHLQSNCKIAGNFFLRPPPNSKSCLRPPPAKNPAHDPGELMHEKIIDQFINTSQNNKPRARTPENEIKINIAAGKIFPVKRTNIPRGVVLSVLRS